MELENIVANTVLLKAREGKLTHVNELGAGLAVFDFALGVREKVGNGRVDDGSGSARLGTAGNPPSPLSTPPHRHTDATVYEPYAMLR